MGSRERKRAERHKRKTRRDPAASGTGGGDNGDEEAAAADAPQPPSRSELKNEAAREALVPLAQGERPRVVTIGAVLSACIAVSVVGAYAFGLTVDGKHPPVVQILVPTLLMGMMAYGMWRARYWAVLGFQVLLVFLILSAALGLTRATSATQAAATGLLLLGAGALFYFMVRAMARIQMPERLPRDR
ncbi:MAG: hypothetical protein QOG09_883 [Solirubrobacterales bacterium]|nr:hypothetical protein [Solirubrobacterales bacterium]